MTKTIWTLNLSNSYSPPICALTYPLLKRWAKKIGAEFHVLSSRSWPKWPPTVEKLQIHYRADEWNIYVDSDALVSPDMFDPTDHLSPDTVLFHSTDMAGNRWRYDEYFRRDGRHIGACNWFAVASNDCRDLWKPTSHMDWELERACSTGDYSTESFHNPDYVEQELDQIHPIQLEINSGLCTREHLIDDYLLSRNIARYGLKITTLEQVIKKLEREDRYLWHAYMIPEEKKIAGMLQVYKVWGLTPSEEFRALVPDIEEFIERSGVRLTRRGLESERDAMVTQGAD